ncbi:hypothetical protein LXL04_016135 [Taraxacum kok-saghyz]
MLDFRKGPSLGNSPISAELWPISGNPALLAYMVEISLPFGLIKLGRLSDFPAIDARLPSGSETGDSSKDKRSKSFSKLTEFDPTFWILNFIQIVSYRIGAYYQIGRCCANVENGSSESFNAVIVDARHKPIITMFEELRIYMMEKLFKSKLKK